MSFLFRPIPSAELFGPFRAELANDDGDESEESEEEEVTEYTPSHLYSSSDTFNQSQFLATQNNDLNSEIYSSKNSQNIASSNNSPTQPNKKRSGKKKKWKLWGKK